MSKYKNVSELTQLNVDLNKAAEDFISLATKAKSEIEKARADVRAKFDSPQFENIPKANRRPFVDAEIRRAMAEIRRSYKEATKENLREIKRIADEINVASELYKPVKRLSLETALDPKLADRRERHQRLLANASVPELETMLDAFESTKDLAGLAALSSITNGDAKLRRAIPTARIVKNIEWDHQEQLDAIFKSGRHMVDVCIEEDRSVESSLKGNARGNTTDRIRRGLRPVNVKDGELVVSGEQ